MIGKDFIAFHSRRIFPVFKKIFFSILILLALIAGGLSYYVSTIDWNKHKDKIAEQIEDITGKKVVINGKINFTIFPTPHLNAKDIKIYNTEADVSKEPLAEVKEMVTDLSLIPLMRKNFVIDKMNLVGARIVVEFLDNGKTNWYSDVDQDQSFSLSDVDIAFNSITLQNSIVRIINKAFDTDVTFTKLNADITAQSIVGPFRIDGNFVKDNTPAGFALNIGTLSESFSTSLNLVLTHPSSESYARFDGSILSNNSEIQGNFTIESQKPSTFLNTISGQILLPEQYNYPLASSIELMINPQQIDLSSFIIKYGDNTAGAGKLLIPLKSITTDPKKIEVSFEMTDLDLMPLAAILEEYLKKYDQGKTPFEPAFEYNLVADMTAMRAHYQGQAIRNLKLSADLVNNVLSIKNLSGLLPGDTDLSVTGDIFENEKLLSYDLKVQSLSQDFLKLLDWLKITPKTYAQATYRNARAIFGLSGNLNQIKIMPFDFNLDKIELSGALGFNRDRRNALFMSLESSNINLDNYLPPLSPEEKKLSALRQIEILLKQLKFLNDIDVRAELFLGLGIYNKIPFENTKIVMDAKDGKINLQQFDIKQIASASVSAQGVLANLSVSPSFENFKYEFHTSDFVNFQKKIDIDFPDWPFFKNAKNVSIKAIASGTFDSSNAKMIAKVEKTNLSYTGRVYRQENENYYRGKLEVKTPDFVDFANRINLTYNPPALSSSIMTFDSDVEGKFNNWRANNFNAFIGSNNFTGSFSYIKKQDKPNIRADIQSNVFEFDRFIYEPKQTQLAKTNIRTAQFLSKPTWNNEKFDYSIIQEFNIDANLAIKNLSYKNNDIENVKLGLRIQDGVIDIKNLTANKNTAKIEANMNILTEGAAKISGSLNVSNYVIENLGGSTYSLLSGLGSFKSEYTASADSVIDFIKTLNGKISFDISNTTIKGIDAIAIEEDLTQRTRSDHLDVFLEQNLKNGQSRFNMLGAEINISNGQYQLQDAIISSDRATIDFSGQGSLIAWDGDLNFTFTFEQLKNQISPIYFQLKGPLENPELTVNTSKIKDKYDTHWQQLEQEAQNKENARKKALKDRMDITQARVSKLMSLINSEIRTRIRRYKQFAQGKSNNNAYESVEVQTDDIYKNLYDMSEKAEIPYNNTDIDDMNLQLDVFEPSLEEFIIRLDDNYMFDLKLQAASDFQKITNIYSNSLEKSKNYQNTLNSYTMRLLQLGSLVVLDQLDTVRENRSIIEASIRNIADVYGQAQGLKNQIEKAEKILIIDKYYQDMNDVLKAGTSEFEKLNTALENLFLYIQDVVYFEQTGKHKQRPDKKTSLGSFDFPSHVEDKTSEQDSQHLMAEKTQNKAPVKFNIEAKPQEEQIAPVPTVETVLEPEASVASTAAEPEAQPLLIKSADDYTSKPVISGTVSRKGQVRSKPQEDKSNQQLLRPVSGEVLIEGTVSRK